jgi:hypothetical protein
LVEARGRLAALRRGRAGFAFERGDRIEAASDQVLSAASVR